MKSERVYSMLIRLMLWGGEMAVIGSAVYATVMGRNAWPLVVLALGFAMVLPVKLPEK